MTEQDQLFSPVRMGDLDLPNRVLMAPLTRNRAHCDGTPADMAQIYYSQRATAGLIISEATQVDPMGKGYLDTPGIHDPSHVAAWRKITDAVHAKGGRIFLQLWHVGRISHVSLLPDGSKPLAPSAVRAETQTFTENGFEDCSEPEAMTLDQIHAVVEQFRRGAEMAQEAGFDGVEIHAANGYLLDQFLQDKTNRRDDAYGGDVANRMRLVSEIIDAVATVLPRGRIGIRLSPLGQANDIGDSDPETLFTQVYEMVSGKNLAYLHVMEQFPGAENDSDAHGMIERLRSHYEGFVISNGGYDGEAARSVIGSGHADAVAFGRPFIANPDLPERLRVGAKLNEGDQDTFYGGDAEGYTDYPFLEERETV
ncbi:N-ethylmaleimide reductase [Palleronia aestuarii]|uniref:N-ethylmaleimide reductase n=1 Tax=Palleronia aestuarii TaxID=568105 RepID=A0A2W7NDS1_9RHOB|nr:alkene reductase [Palleronia aestuarii]PZX17743.1 N-ethylmaleimide reductase [Palleronia aestuarii]